MCDAGPSISTSGHLDGTDIDVDAVQQPGVDDSDDVMKPPEGSVECVAPSLSQAELRRTCAVLRFITRSQGLFCWWRTQVDAA